MRILAHGLPNLWVVEKVNCEYLSKGAFHFCIAYNIKNINIDYNTGLKSLKIAYSP